MNNSNDSCYPQDIFLNQNFIKKFLCPIDFGVCRDPVLDKCGHSFGKNCINQWIKKKNTCPLTNQNYEDNPAFPENYAIKEFLHDLEVKCINHEKFCNWKGILENLESHLKKDCGMEVVSCENEKCTQKIARKMMPEHLKNECLYSQIDCLFKSKGCNAKMQRILQIQHLGEKHSEELKNIIDNHDQNQIQMQKFKEIVEDQAVQIEDFHKNSVSKKEFMLLKQENSQLKTDNSNLQQEIKNLEYKIKEACLKLLEKEKEMKLMESQINVKTTINDKSQNYNSTSKTFTKSHTISEEIQPIKKQHVEEANNNPYNYPQMTLYNPITGKDLSQTKNFIRSPANIKETFTPSHPIDPLIFDNIAHENSINFLLILNLDDNGKLLASCADDNLIKIWDINKTFQLLKTLQGHISAVHSLLHKKEMQALISASNDETIRIWSISNWQCLKIIEGRTKLRVLMNYSRPDQFIAGGIDFKVRVWSNEKGNYSHETLATLNGEICALEAIAFGDINEFLVGDSKGYLHIMKDELAKKSSSYFNMLFKNNVTNNSSKCHDSKILALKYIKEKDFICSSSLIDGKLKIHKKSNFHLITELPICGSGYCILDIKIDQNANDLVIVGTSDEKMISIGIGDWNIRKTYEREGFGVNKLELDFRGGFIYSCGTIRDKKDCKFKYIIRARKI